MTRRIVKPQPTKDINIEQLIKGNPIKKDIVLWVKETFEGLVTGGSSRFNLYSYKADDDKPMDRWESPLYMPKVAARIFLKVVNVRVGRLQNITKEDCLKEGVIKQKEISGVFYPFDNKYYFNTIDTFNAIWESINGLESWNENPFVWVYEFERIDKPSDWNY